MENTSLIIEEIQELLKDGYTLTEALSYISGDFCWYDTVTKSMGEMDLLEIYIMHGKGWKAEFKKAIRKELKNVTK
jgi:hypothetical protein